MQVDRYDAIRSRAFEQVRDELRRNWRASFVLPILPGIPEIRDHRRYPRRTGPTQRVDPDHQLHQMGIDRMTRRLHDKAVASADVLLDPHDQLAIRKEFRTPP